MHLFEPVSMLLLATGDDAVRLPLALLIVFGTTKLLSEIFEALGQPGIVGEILAGALVGPSLLNWVQPNEVLSTLAELGVMFLLFRVGLEVKSSELTSVGLTAAIVAALGVLLPFLSGWGIMLFAGAPQIEAVFVGAAMVATSIGITAQVLAAKGVLQERSSHIILAAAVIDDVLGLLVLALVSSVAKGQVNVAGLVTTAAAAIGFTLIIAVFGTRAMRSVMPPIQLRLKAGEAQFNVALFLMFALAVLAVYAGVAAIIGAFLAGMALSETVSHRVHDLAQGTTELLVPFFLAGIGLNLDIQAFVHPRTLVLSLVILVAAVASKLIGCGLAAWRLGWADMVRVGSGMIPRGEVGMVVAQIGLGMGVISQPVYAVAVFMAVTTTLVAPPLLKYAYRDCKPIKAEERFGLG